MALSVSTKMVSVNAPSQKPEIVSCAFPVRCFLKVTKQQATHDPNDTSWIILRKVESIKAFFLFTSFYKLVGVSIRHPELGLQHFSGNYSYFEPVDAVVSSLVQRSEAVTPLPLAPYGHLLLFRCYLRVVSV